MATVVRAEDVSKRFELHHDKSLKERLVNMRRTRVEEFWALHNISFEIEESHTLGLIGANGSGKSTLLKLIAGILTPTTGYVSRRGRVAALLELGAGFHPDLTGRENVYMNASILGLTRKDTDKYFDDIIDFSGIERFIDNQVKFYSSGMYLRLAFSVAVHVEPEILLVDEVLAVGDEPFQVKCMKRIRQFQQEGRTIIYVSHGFDAVRALCDRVFLLDKGELIVDGTAQEATRAFRDKYAAELGAGDGPVQTSEVKIAEVVITDGEGNRKYRFEPGETLGAVVTLEADQLVEDPVVAISIHNHIDSLIFGTDTATHQVALGGVKGQRRLRFDFGAIPMVEGQYFVSAAVHSRDKTVRYHSADHQASFKVFSGVDELGLIHLDTRIVLDD
jgi:ABC-2 type transport system ATP-binding protein